jgi:hypothetical protein
MNEEKAAACEKWRWKRPSRRSTGPRIQPRRYLAFSSGKRGTHCIRRAWSCTHWHHQRLSATPEMDGESCAFFLGLVATVFDAIYGAGGLLRLLRPYFFDIDLEKDGQSKNSLNQCSFVLFHLTAMKSF